MSHETLVTEGGADPRIGMMLQDRYRILRKLGEGGMGSVYEGEHVLIKRRVAIKCLHSHYANSPDIVARFHREALAATSIGHPNIIECTDMGRFPDGAFFMVLEFLDGRDWAADLATTGPQPLGRVVHVMAQVCDALGAAHAKGIIHRDLKPENIFLIKRGGDPDFVKVLDFGISKIQDQTGDPETQAKSKGLTRTGMAMGTPYFMAPEQAQGKRDIDHRADIYALGVILFQVLTGQYPFDDDSYPMLVVKICTQDAPHISRWRPDLPDAVQALVMSMLAKAPEARPQTCADVKAALEPFRSQMSAPVIAADAPSTASLAPGTFGQAPAAIPATTPAQQAVALPDSGASTGPFAAQPAITPVPRVRTPQDSPASARPSVTPFATSDADELPRASTPVPPTSRAPMIVGAVISVLGLMGIAGAIVIASSGPDAPEPTPPVAATQPPAPQPEPPPTPEPTHVEAPIEAARAQATVTVQISTEPEDAEVYLDDRRIPNPFDGDLPQTTEPRNLRVQREGYVTQVQDLVLEFPQRVRVRLTRGRGVQDHSTAGRAASARRASTTSATQEEPAVVPTVTREPEPQRAAEPTPPPAVETPRTTEPETTTPAAEGEGGRRTLKNPFGRR
ncbi:serine/threonine-protein kinase [Sandaracinus amylolyticus]|uniref:Serine/threonine protein kinase n=1 Tax=Sandaracinus amylolyticus TaxID=927083 RepID=A0A0F6W6J7_9BACT|nr:serine/threonine-protein kinase [Sandaracinus amylolyticus]AKF08793.1 serine/threonine protein kinase [Sandaracinus amylolyticus]